MPLLHFIPIFVLKALSVAFCWVTALLGSRVARNAASSGFSYAISTFILSRCLLQLAFSPYRTVPADVAIAVRCLSDNLDIPPIEVGERLYLDSQRLGIVPCQLRYGCLDDREVGFIRIIDTRYGITPLSFPCRLTLVGRSF